MKEGQIVLNKYIIGVKNRNVNKNPISQYKKCSLLIAIQYIRFYSIL